MVWLCDGTRGVVLNVSFISSQWMSTPLPPPSLPARTPGFSVFDPFYGAGVPNIL